MVEYAYDAWGATTSITGEKATTIGAQNPFRYGGYYCDTETGLYYLKTRYYDPTIGRFISADEISMTVDAGDDLLCTNLYAYCVNDPVNKMDGDGQWGWFKKLCKAVEVVKTVASTTVGKAVIGALATAAAIAIAPCMIPATLATVATSTLIGGVTSAISGGNFWKGAAQGFMEGGLSALAGASVARFAGKACFVAGTPVLAASGTVPIEQIEAGDYVWAHNPETGQTALKRVVQTFERQKDELIHLFADDEEITTTEEHPFYVPQRGWVDAGQLLVGDELVLYDGRTVVIEKVWRQYLCSPVTVYNFEVEDFHTYFVGEDAVLVHNACHGNSLKSKKKTDLYVLKNNTTGKIEKIGETTRGVRRYTKAYYKSKNVTMKVIASGSKLEMHTKQHNMLKAYYKINNRLPNLNLSFY